MTASPTLASRLPPQQRHAVGGGTTTRSRGRCAGNGRRAGLLPHMGANHRALPAWRFGGRLVLGHGLLELGQLELELLDQPAAALAGLRRTARAGLWPGAASDARSRAWRRTSWLRRCAHGLRPRGAHRARPGSSHAPRRDRRAADAGLGRHTLYASTSASSSEDMNDTY